MLAERRQITVSEAFELLRRHARTHNLRLSELARDVAERSGTVSELLQAAQPAALPDSRMQAV